MDTQRNQNNDLPYLSKDQIYGIRQFRLTLEQVQTPNFGLHTLEGIQDLINQRRAANYHTAFDILNNLNEDQVRGITDFELTRTQVNTLNFGEHTLDAIRDLRARNINLTTHEAFQQIQGLTPSQTTGVVHYELAHEQVSTENFGQHTLIAMDTLRNRDQNTTNQEAFEILSGLDNHQTIGISQYRLARNNVLDSSFGEHTLTAMQELVYISMENGNDDFTLEDAFDRLRGLDVFQTRAVVDFRLNREQVMHPTFGESILNTMQTLLEYNSELTGNHLYDFVMQMPEYQVRGITKYDFTPKELGINLEGNEIFQLDPRHNYFASGSTVDAVGHLITTEGVPREEAYQIVLELSTIQTLAIIDFGLSLEQVQSPFFLESENILDKLLPTLQDENEDMNLPLWPEDQEKARAIMASLMLEYSLSNKTAKNKPGLRTKDNNSTALVNEAIAPPIGTALDKADTNEFLRYAYSRDFLGIFDGIKQVITTQEAQNLTPDLSAPRPDNNRETATSLYLNGVASIPDQDNNSLSSQEQFYSNDLKALTSPISFKTQKAGNLKIDGKSKNQDTVSERKRSAKKTPPKKATKTPKL